MLCLQTANPLKAVVLDDVSTQTGYLQSTLRQVYARLFPIFITLMRQRYRSGCLLTRHWPLLSQFWPHKGHGSHFPLTCVAWTGPFKLHYTSFQVECTPEKMDEIRKKCQIANTINLLSRKVCPSLSILQFKEIPKLKFITQLSYWYYWTLTKRWHLLLLLE